MLLPQGIFFCSQKQTSRIQKLAAKILKNEITISVSSKGLSFLFSIPKSENEQMIPEIDVAKATPEIFRGNIKIVFKIIFNPKASPEIFAGVTVSFKAKKQDCRILVTE
jgi:hypothetical protein